MDIGMFLLSEDSKAKPTDSEGIATVVNVTSTGVKIHLATEVTPRDTEYNSLEVVSKGQKVYYRVIRGDLFIIGSFKY